jgi:tRNA-dihydrouridine synthase
VAEQGETIRRHHAWSIEVHGERLGTRLMRKFGIKYSEMHPAGTEVRDAFIRVKHTRDLEAVLAEWYAPDKPWPTTRRKSGPGDLVAAGASPE